MGKNKGLFFRKESLNVRSGNGAHGGALFACQSDAGACFERSMDLAFGFEPAGAAADGIL